MITQDEAARIVERVVGVPADDESKGWTLEEFDRGWLVHEKAAVGIMGAGTRVVEKESGRVMNFRSNVPPRRIRTQYDAVLIDAFQEDPSPGN